jgi:hypothetical protein
MKILAVALALLPTTTFAAVVEQSIIVGQPQMFVNEGQVTSCGLRLSAQSMSAQPDKQRKVLLIDSSLMMGRSGLVLIKGLGINATAEGLPKGQFERVGLSRFWIKPDDTRATTPKDGKILNSDDDVSILYGDKEPFEVYIGFMRAVTQKKPISIGFRLASGGDERILRGTIDLSESEMETFLSCNRDLVK